MDELLPEGRYSARCVHATRGVPPWGGAERLSLRLAVEHDGAERSLFSDTPLDHDKRLAAIAAAFGVAADTLTDGDLGGLVDSQVEIVLGHYTKRDGTTGQGARLFLPAPLETHPRAVDEPAPQGGQHAAPPTDDAEAALVERVARRVIELLETRGVSTPKPKRPAPKRDVRSPAVKVCDAAEDDDLPF